MSEMMRLIYTCLFQRYETVLKVKGAKGNEYNDMTNKRVNFGETATAGKLYNS